MQNIDAAQAFSALSNTTRLRCLHLVFRNPEVCVCEAVAALEISQPAVSKAMAALKSLGLLDARRDANWTYFRMNPHAPGWLQQVVEITLSVLDQQLPYSADQQAFLALELRTTATTEA